MNAIDRRAFLAAAASSALVTNLKYASAQEATKPAQVYRRFEDLYRNKWTWDRVSRGTHGTNCAGTCAFNVFIKNGVVWREEQQAMYDGHPDSDTPDYGPRGCQKGLRHAKYMYGKQRILYPMKRVGKRGEGKWERVTWEQAAREIADKFLDVSNESGPQAISWGSGTQMSVKVASYSALARFANISGVTVPEFYSGVGDLPTGVYMTVGQVYLGDVMASVYKSKCVLVWMANPAVTRIPDAHFFWEAKYNGTEVIAISPEFTPTAMHSSMWVNPKPGTDIALAMSMVHTILEDKSYNAPYIKEQTDMPFLVRKDTGRFLLGTDMSIVGKLAVDENVFYVWDQKTNKVVQAPGTGMAAKPLNRERRKYDSIALGDIEPALEGTWKVDTLDGEIEVTTVFEILKTHAAEHSPEKTQSITGLHPSVVKNVARKFAAAKPGMIYSGYASCKWLNGDMLQRAMMMLLALTGSTGQEGGGIQFANAPKAGGMLAFAFADVGPATRIVSATTWDYDHGNMKALNEQVYGKELADRFDSKYKESVREAYFPKYHEKGWRMGFFMGNNGANWRASGKKWREDAFEKLETIVALAPDMGVTPFYADYVLPIAHHYERADIMFQSRTPYIQILDSAVPPLGEAVDDWDAIYIISKAISDRAKERKIESFFDEVDGRSVRRDPQRYHDLYTMDGRIRSVRDVIQFIINTTPGVPKMSFAEMAKKGIVRVDDSDIAAWNGDNSPYHNDVFRCVRDKRPYETLTGRQQYYVDHPWFLEDGEQLPSHRAPMRIPGYPMQFMMGHARHGIHSMWRDDHLLLQLQRGEPDIYINPKDASARGVEDGDLVRVFSPLGEFFVNAHLSNGIQPGMLFMYHGWDPMMFKNRQNFGAVITTAGLIKPTSVAGDYGHLGYRVLAFAPNQTYKDFTCEFELAERRNPISAT